MEKLTKFAECVKAYGQQKNREHIWDQAKSERLEYKKLRARVLGSNGAIWSELDEDMTGVRYEQLCDHCNITPW